MSTPAVTFSQGSRSQLAIVEESVFGDGGGANPTLTLLPIKGHSLNLSKESIEGQDIRADRQRQIYRHGNRQAGGDLNVDLRAVDFDLLLRSAFFSDYKDPDATGTPDTLIAGTNLVYFAIEDQLLDTGLYRFFTGCQVDSMSMTVEPNAMVDTTFTIVAKDGVNDTASVSGSAPTASSGTQPFDSFSGVIREGGTLAGDEIAVVTSLELNLENGVSPTYVVGSPSTPFLEYGRSAVSGTLQTYIKNFDLLDKFINETESSIQFELGFDGYKLIFTLPRVKYNGGDMPLENEQSRIMSIPFVALLDTAEGTAIKMKKVTP